MIGSRQQALEEGQGFRVGRKISRLINYGFFSRFAPKGARFKAMSEVIYLISLGPAAALPSMVVD
jgi:hypothetical protein